MSNKKRQKNRKKKSKPQNTVQQVKHQEPAQPEPTSSPDRFVFAKEIGERMGGVGATAVRQWGRQGKIKLRRMFGDSGQYGMPESQLIRIINGGSEE